MQLGDWRREKPRFGPVPSVSAALLDGDSPLAQGVLANISESGARVVTNVGVSNGRLVRVKLRSVRRELLDTWARIMWSTEGLEAPMNLVGTLQGIQFAAPSWPERQQIQKLLVRSGWAPRVLGSEEHHFDPLVDQDIESFFAGLVPTSGSGPLEEALVTPVDEFEDLCRSVQPFLEKLVSKLVDANGVPRALKAQARSSPTGGVHRVRPLEVGSKSRISLARKT